MCSVRTPAESSRETLWQHVLKKSTNELFGRDFGSLDLISRRFLVLKGDLAESGEAAFKVSCPLHLPSGPKIEH